MLRFIAFPALLLTLSACSSWSSSTLPAHQQPYWSPPAGIFSTNAPAPPPLVMALRPGLTRGQVYERLGDAARIVHSRHGVDARLEEWEEVELPEGHLDLWFGLHFTKEQKCCGCPIPANELKHQRCDKLHRLRFTNHARWVLWYGEPDQ